MSALGLVLLALTLLSALLILGRLHLLSQSLSERSSEEAKYLRAQVERLQEQVLALTAPAAQARLHRQAQEQRQEPQAPQAAAAAAKVVPLPTLSPRRSPLAWEIPDRLNDPHAFNAIQDDEEIS